MHVGTAAQAVRKSLVEPAKQADGLSRRRYCSHARDARERRSSHTRLAIRGADQHGALQAFHTAVLKNALSGLFDQAIFVRTPHPPIGPT